VLAAPFSAWPVLTIGILLVALAGATALLGHRRVASKQS
jgi:hypothetical protein